MRERLQNVVRAKSLFVLAGLMVALQPLYGVFTAPIAGAASNVAYTTQPLTADAWSADRTTPSGGYGLEAYAGRDSLRIGIDNTLASSGTGFYRTEGVKRSIGEADVIKADLYIDGNWMSNSKDVRAGLWGVGRNSSDAVNAYPIVEFTRTADFTGWRIWQSNDGVWQNLTTGFATNKWSKLTLMRNKANQALTDVYINGTMVGQSAAEDTEYYGEMILNSFNYATSAVNNYNVHWSNIQTGEYTLDANYVLPNASRDHFRPSDNAVRLKVNDEMQQFDRLQFEVYDANTDVYEGVYEVDRSQCTPNGAGSHLLCDIKDAINWGSVADGTYITKLTAYATWSSTAVITTSMSEHWSQPFTIDTAKPTTDGLVLESPVNGYTNSSATLAATASDDNAVESVNFYVTTPRVNDDECDGKDMKLVENRVSAADVDGKYRTTLDLSALADGEYCITAQARDQAKNNGNRQHVKVMVDKTAPTLVIQTPNENAVFGGDDQIVVTSLLEDGLGLENFFIDINNANVTILSDPDEVEAMPEGATTEEATSTGLTVITIYNAADFANGEYVITARVTDKAGNVTEQNRTIFIDHSVPSVPPTPGSGSGTPPTSDTTTDETDDELARLTQQLTQPFSVPRSFIGSANSTQTNQDVLGIDNGEENEVASGEQIVAAAPSEDGWKIFGIAWYWWLLLATILGIITAWIMRRRSAEA